MSETKITQQIINFKTFDSFNWVRKYLNKFITRAHKKGTGVFFVLRGGGGGGLFCLEIEILCFYFVNVLSDLSSLAFAAKVR